MVTKGPLQRGFIALIMGVLTLFLLWDNRRVTREAERVGAELGTYYGDRDRESADREAQMLKLTQTLTRLTWLLLVLCLGTFAGTLWAISLS
jgi:hypothetical protein